MLILLIAAAGAGPTARPAPKRPLFQQEVIKYPAFDAEAKPDWAADHEIEIEETPFWGPPRTERYFRIRSGGRYREGRVEQKDRQFSYIDLATRAQTSYSVGDDGGYRTVAINRPERVGTYSFFSRIKTSERDHVLGEDCDVWDTVRIAKNEIIPPSIFQSCLTADGIEMWTRIKRKDEITPFRKTVALKRRKVALSEVVPRRDILDPARWSGFLSETPARPGHVMVMRGVKVDYEPSTVSRETRTSGAWAYQQDDLDTGARRWHIINRESGLQFNAEQAADGSLQSLSFTDHQRPIPNEQYQAMGTSGTFIGEQCRWVTRAHPGPHDYGKECHADDGAVLYYESGDSRYGGHVQLTATAILRGAIPRASVMPPAELLSAKRWRLWP